MFTAISQLIKFLAYDLLSTVLYELTSEEQLDVVCMYM